MAQLPVAFRSLAKARVFALVAILSLAIAMGANSALFSLIDSVLLKPLPGIVHPERLVSIYHVSTRNLAAFSSLSWPDFEYYASRARSFSGMLAYLRLPFAVRFGDRTSNVPGELVSDSYFRVLGIQPKAGRDFMEGERDPVVLIGERLWRERFGANPTLIGSAIHVAGRPFTVVGIVPAAFRGIVLDWGDRPEMWIPMRFYAEAIPHLKRFDMLHAWGMHAVLVTGRLNDGVAPEQAAVEIDTLAAALDSEQPARARTLHGEWLARALPLQQARFWPGARSQIVTVLAVLGVVAASVLLIACANIASLMLTRAVQRHREVALRFALGARTRDVARLLFAESILIVVPACLIGLLLATALTRALATFPKLFSIPLALDFRLDLRVVAFTAAAGALVTTAMGLVPLSQSLRTNLVNSLRTAGVSATRRRWNAGGALTAVQIALALVLVVQAGLLLRTFQNAAETDPFLRSGNLLIGGIDLPSDREAKAELELARELPSRIRTIGGVRDAVLTSVLPLSGMRSAADVTLLDTSDGAPQKRNVDINAVSPGFFRLSGSAIVQGRDFNDGDINGRPPVAVVNEVLAARYWNGDAVGCRLTIRGDTVTVVGVVRDLQRRNYRAQVPPRAYFPMAQRQAGGLFLVTRTYGDPVAVLPRVQSAVAQLDPDAILASPRTLASYADIALAPERLAAWCVGALAVIALVLSSVGLYGTMAYSVSQRTAEIGIRVALGGSRARVTRAVLRPAFLLAAGGVACGSALAAVSIRFTRSLLFGVTGADPVTWVAAGLILATAVVIAAAVPALRASRIDPAAALRCE